MKVDFKTSKGQFIFVKVTDLACYTDHTLNGVCYIETKDDRVLNINTGDKKVEWSSFVKDLTEAQWSEVVDEFGVGINHQGVWEHYAYQDYVGDYEHEGYITATESGESLMNSLNLEIGNWLLIKYK